MMSAEAGRRACDQCGTTTGELVAVDQNHRPATRGADSVWDYCTRCLHGIQEYDKGECHAALTLLQRAAVFALDSDATEDDLHRALEEAICEREKAEVLWV
jgi:hypothetical protein